MPKNVFYTVYVCDYCAAGEVDRLATCAADGEHDDPKDDGEWEAAAENFWRHFPATEVPPPPGARCVMCKARVDVGVKV